MSQQARPAGSSASPSNSSVQFYEVQLAVYDLSRGMARSLSAQFLGPQFAVDAIPHTGLVVYGIEYFFGSGSIQSQNPHTFRQTTGLNPLQLLPLGRTQVSQQAFEQWCRSKVDDGTFHGTNYDLLQHNCNTFSHIAALQALRLPQGVPNWILQVPQRFQASPMGQLLVPMLEQMQLTSVVPGASTVAVGGGGADAGTAAQEPNIRVVRSNTATTTNPWATVRPTEASGTATVHRETTTPPTTPALESLAKPLRSAETSMVPMCVQKLAPLVDDPDCLQQMANHWSQATTSTLEPATLRHRVSATLLTCLQNHPKQASFALLLLRLVLLLQPQPRQPQLHSLRSSNAASNLDALDECLSWTRGQLVVRNGTNGNSSSLSSTARVAAWLVFVNVAATAAAVVGTDDAPLNDHDDRLIEAALADWNPSSPSSPPVAVRQAAASFLYNTALRLSQRSTVDEKDGVDNDDNDDERSANLVTSLLCSAMEGLEDEVDPTCSFRRLLVLGRLLLGPPAVSSSEIRPGSVSVVIEDRRRLAVDLGIRPVLTQLILAPPKAPEATLRTEPSIESLAREILALLPTC